MAPEPSSTSSVFGRRPSLFSGKKRKESIAPTSPPPVSEEASPLERRDSSVVSLPSSVNEGSNLHRSVSVASHNSQSSLTRHKSRAPSVANIQPSKSPIRLHRVSRSISANAAGVSGLGGKFGSFSSSAAISPQKSHENISPLNRPRDLEGGQKTSFSMLAAPFGHAVKRQDTSTSTFTTKQSFSGEGGNAAIPPTAFGGALNPTVIHNSITETSNKRIATLEYLRKL